MLCLSLLLPGKVGRVIRKIMLPILSIMLLYAVIWISIVKCVRFEPGGQAVQDKNLILTINVKNDSFAGVEIRDLNLINRNGEYVKKVSCRFPVRVPSHGEKRMTMKFAIDDYREIETTVKTLYAQFTFKNDIGGS